LGKTDWSVYTQNIQERMTSGKAYFDGRMFNLPFHEVANYIYWRSSYDCKRNSISGLARVHFSDKQMHAKCSDDLLKMMREKNIEWEEQPMEFRYGFLVKKKRFEKTSLDKSNNVVTVVRTAPFVFTKIITHTDCDMLAAKYYE
jgi:tRNA(His) 5'-end guanylyltransferase